MAPNTSYGNFANHCGSLVANLATYVCEALGDYGDDYDTDALERAYRDAINKTLAGSGITLAGDEFYGPYPAIEGAREIIAAAIESVDFWALAAKFDQTAGR